MGYIGQTPSAVPLTSADIAGGTITNDDLAGSIADAKISALAASKLTGTIATARLGSGTASSSTFLRGDQTYAAAGGGAWTLIESQTASADATIDFTSGINSTYDTYILVGSALVLNTGGGFDFLASTDGGSSWLSSYSLTVHKKHEAGYDGASVTDQSVFDMDYGQEHASGEMASFTIWVDDPSGAVDRKGVRSDLLYFGAGGDGAGSISHGSINSTSAVNAFRIDASGGAATITTGRVTLFGLKHT